METKDKDSLRGLFSVMPYETLPENFHVKTMQKIMQEAARREKRRRFWEICVYVSGFAAMAITCVLVLYYSDVSFSALDLKTFAWSFPKPDFELFRSPSFGFSLHIGLVALFLLIVDSTIRRRIEKNRE